MRTLKISLLLKFMNKKPEKCCHPDCVNCPYDDCYYDKLEYSDIKEQDRFDKGLEIVDPEVAKRRKRQQKYNRSDKGKNNRKKYNQSEKGKACQKKYLKTDKGKETRRRYEQSEKGKAMRKRQYLKKIASGKNAEHCRQYRLRKKMQKENLIQD